MVAPELASADGSLLLTWASVGGLTPACGNVERGGQSHGRLSWCAHDGPLRRADEPPAPTPAVSAEGWNATGPPMPIHWLYDVPKWLLAVLVVGAAVGLSVGGLRVTRSLQGLVSNDVAGAVLATVGLVHGILLALVAVAAWGNYTAAAESAEREADALANMVRHLDGYPEPERERLTVQLRAYLDLVITDEWPALQRDRTSERTARARDALAREWATFDPETGREQVLHGATTRELEAVLDARQARLAAGRAGLPTPLWTVVLLGSALTVACCYLFRLDDGRARLVVTSVVAASLGLVIYLILVLDHPVWGARGLGPDPFVEVSRLMGGR